MKYDAFISYRHLERDMFVAKKIHKALETISIPRKIQKEIGRKKINRVFRDQEELPIGSDLGSNIEAALREAEFLIVICSPKTKESYWVMKEIDTFIEMHGRENILAILVDGEPEEAFPPQILVDEKGDPVEPLAADVRGNSKGKVMKKLKTESLRLAAAILKIDYDDLKQRDRERKLRRNTAIVAGVAAVAIAFGAFTAYNLAKLDAEYQQKLINESKVFARTSLDILERGDREAAALVAMEGLPGKDKDRPFVPEAMYALSQAMGVYNMGGDMEPVCILEHDVNVSEFAENKDGTRVVSADFENTVYFWDLETGKCVYKLLCEYDNNRAKKVLDVGFIGDIVVVITEDKVRGYDFSGQVKYEVPIEGGVSFGNVDINERYVQVVSSQMDESYNIKWATIFMDGQSGEVILEVENQVEPSFSSEAAFSKDGKYAAVSHLVPSYGDEEPKQNYVTIVNLGSKESKDVPIAENTVMDMTFTEDGALIVDSMNANVSSDDSLTQYVEKIDAVSGDFLWKRDFDYDLSSYYSLYIHVRSVISKDEDGSENAFVGVSGTKCVHVLDLYTGQDVSTVNTDSDPENFLFSKASGYMLVGCSDGKINIYDCRDGSKVQNSEVDIKDTIVDFDSANSVMVARMFRNPNLVVLRLVVDTDSFAEAELDNRYYYGAASSPSGKTYVLLTSPTGATEEADDMVVIDTKTGKQIGQFDVVDARLTGVFYVDEDTIATVNYNGEIVYYSIGKEKTDVFKVSDRMVDTEYGISANKKYAVFSADKRYYVVDVNKRKTIKEGTIDYSVTSFDISNDASTLCYTKLDGTGWVVDLKNGSTKSLLNDKIVSCFKISPDGKNIAAACTDGVLRIVNIDNGKVEDEIAYHGKDDDFVEYSQDGKYLYLQGENLYFQIYDLESKEVKYITNNQIMDVHRTSFDEKNNWLAIFNQEEMYIIDLNTFGILNYVDNGVLYIPEQKVIVGVRGKALKEYKVKTADELMKAAIKKYGDAKLSDIEKLKYQIN